MFKIFDKLKKKLKLKLKFMIEKWRLYYGHVKF